MPAAILLGAVAAIAYQSASQWDSKSHGGLPLESLLALLFVVWLVCGIVRSLTPRRPQESGGSDR
jgi:hypothetical protein